MEKIIKMSTQSLYQYLKQNGFKDEYIATIFLLLHPHIDEYIQVQFASTFDVQEVVEIENEADEQKLDNMQKALLYAEVYKQKTNKDISDEINYFFDKFVEALEQTKSLTKELLDELQKQQSNPTDKEVDSLIEKIINRHKNLLTQN